MALPTPDQQYLSPEEVQRQKLMQMLSAGTGTPSDPAAGGAPPANPGLPDPTAAPPMRPPTLSGKTDPLPAPSAAQPAAAPPTAQPLTAAPATPEQGYADEYGKFKQENPQAGGVAPSYQQPSLKNRLLHGLFYGMEEYGRPGEGAKAEQSWEQQNRDKAQAVKDWPKTQETNYEQAFGKQIQDETSIANRDKAEADAKKALNPPETSKLGVDEQIAKAAQSNDQAELDRLIDVKARIYKAEHTNDPTPKSMFEMILKDHPDWTYDQVQEALTRQQNTSAQKPEIVAQIGPEPVAKSYPGGENDPKFKADRLAWGKNYEQHLEAESAAQGASRGAAYMANRMYSVIDTANGNRPSYASGSMINADNEMSQKNGTAPRYLTPQGQKEITKETVIQDVRGSLANVKEDLGIMKNGFTPNVRAALAVSLADPNGTPEKFLQSIPLGSLDDAQQHYVIDLFSLREVANGLRLATNAGAGAEDIRRSLIQTLPSASTPSAEYGKKQIDAVEGILSRVERGVGNVPIRPENAPNANTEKHEPRMNPMTGKDFKDGDRRRSKATGTIEVYQGGQWQAEQQPPTRQ